MSPERRAELVAQWRRRSIDLDLYAVACRREGDTSEAEDAEQAAVDCRQAADELERYETSQDSFSGDWAQRMLRTVFGPVR